MRLIKMTDFVLAESKGVAKFKYTSAQIRDYANFLKQKITRDMFIGDKALFLRTQKIKDIWWGLESYKSIEDLFNSGVDLFLTPYAIKQLGI